MIPLAMVNIENLGYDTILVGQFGTTFALTAVLIAMYIKMRDKKRKALAVPMIISGFCGVTEPGIYGYALPEKKPFIFACIAAAIGGGVFALMGGHQYIIGGLGIFGVVSFISPAGDATSMYYSFICIAVSMIIGFLLTYFLWNDQSGENAAAENGNGTKGSGAGAVEGAVLSAAKEEETILSPMSGQVIGLGELKDEAFNSGMMGDGVGLVPTEGKVVSPVAGTISTLFPTLHAIGITSDSGAEILIHVGMDTVELNGKGFKAYVKQDDHVEQGQHLLDVDLKTIKDAGYSIQTPVLVVNSADMREVEKTDKKEVKINESLMTVKYAR